MDAAERRARRATWESHVVAPGTRAEEDALDARFQLAVPEDDRATLVWELSRELFTLSRDNGSVDGGEEPIDERRLPRSAFRVERR